jgi:hypothetical protein
MSAPRFNVLELLELVRACGSLHLKQCPPSFLGDYLAGNLAAPLPRLAAKVRQLDEPQLDHLCDYLQGARALGQVLVQD